MNDDGNETFTPLTGQDVESLMRRTQVAMEFQGYWVAHCVCGQESGMCLDPLMEDAKYYVACPACGRTGRDGDVTWVKIEPGEES